MYPYYKALLIKWKGPLALGAEMVMCFRTCQGKKHSMLHMQWRLELTEALHAPWGMKISKDKTFCYIITLVRAVPQDVMLFNSKLFLRERDLLAFSEFDISNWENISDCFLLNRWNSTILALLSYPVRGVGQQVAVLFFCYYLWRS